MENMTVLVRWCCTPRAHIGFITDEVQKWFVCRWTYPDNKHLTVVCVQIARDRIESYTSKMLKVMANLWAHHACKLMASGMGDALLDAENDTTDALSNRYRITHAAMTLNASFFIHVTDTTALVKAYRWNLRKDLTNGDNETMFKLLCKHESHSVMVSLPGSEGNILIAHCHEPQRIHDLLKRHDLTCSGVWDATVALSARAPCTAPRDHGMKMVRVNEIPWNDTFGEATEVSAYHDDMGHICVLAEPGSLKHRSRPGPRLAVDGAELVPVTLYYSDRMDKVNDIIKADGRFVPSARYATLEGVSSDKRVLEVEPDGGFIAADPESSDAENLQAFTCFACHNTADGVLDCGHLCCVNCAPRLCRGFGIVCGLCQNPSTQLKTVLIPERFTFSCDTCRGKKEWLANCSHLTCRCYGERCPVCHEPICALQKVFIP